MKASSLSPEIQISSYLKYLKTKLDAIGGESRKIVEKYFYENESHEDKRYTPEELRLSAEFVGSCEKFVRLGILNKADSQRIDEITAYLTIDILENKESRARPLFASSYDSIANSYSFTLKDFLKDKCTEKSDRCAVYLIDDKSSDHYKIGLSSSPETRLKAIRCASGRDCDLRQVKWFDTRKEAQAFEKKAHQKLRKSRVNGEWFKGKLPLSLFSKDAQQEAQS